MLSTELIDALINNTKRKEMIWKRKRKLDNGHDPYTDDEFFEMFGPYLKDFNHEGLSPGDIRFIETIISG